jgi:RNA recognition motif-containing protein
MRLGVCHREEALQAVFAPVVAVREVRLVRDKFSGAPRDFAFVQCASVADAGRALRALQGAPVPRQAGPLRLCYARERAPTGAAADALQARARELQPRSNTSEREVLIESEFKCAAASLLFLHAGLLWRFVALSECP